MMLFAMAAILIAAIHLVAAAQRPRLAVLVSAILWLLYAVYEYLVATGVLCEADCNIRVDLVFFIPILALATFCAYRAYMGQPGQLRIIGTVLGIVGLLAIALALEGHGHGALSGVALLAALAIGIYAVKSRPRTNRP